MNFLISVTQFHDSESLSTAYTAPATAVVMVLLGKHMHPEYVKYA